MQQVLDEARTGGATSAEADIGTGEGLSVTVRMGELETVEYQRDKGLGITVYMEQRKGSSSTSDFSKQAIKDSVQAACAIARHASTDEYAGLIAADYLAKEIPDLDLHHPWNITPEEATALAIDCETVARQSDARITNADGTVVNSYSGKHIYGNSHGFIGGWDWSSHVIDCTVIADENGMQRDGWFSKARDALDLENTKIIGEKAAERTVARLGARKLSTRQAPVLFEAPVASGLFGAFIGAISGGSLYRKASFMLDKIDQQVFAKDIHIHENPWMPKALGSAPFDSDGMATGARDLVKDGVLLSYVLSAYSARKLNMTPTGNAGGVHNLFIEPGDQDFDSLISTMHTGLLVTDMIGFGVNQITGDYSRGASGFWVENGEIQYPVEEITVAGNLLDMYMQIIAIGNDVDSRGNTRTGSVLIENMTVAGE
ncbi:MAG: PmbA protein [Gammaproteobacteria bacterium]|jgi:PmbA protein